MADEVTRAVVSTSLRLPDRGKPLRILSLDGGGMRGLFSASVVAGVEEIIHRPIIDCIDLVVGTSTGGLIALGLASGKSGEEMVQLYLDHGDQIFSGKRRLTQLVRPKYPRRHLDQALERYFGDLKMKDLEIPTCVPAYEAVAGKTRVYKTNHDPTLYWGHEQLVRKVAAATSAAPTYFAPVQIEPSDAHVDGGVWANNPAVLGITEAVNRFKRPLTEVKLLSVGTAAPPARVESFERARRMGLIRWIKPALTLLQGGAAMGIHFQALQLLGEGNYLRVDDPYSTEIRLDDLAACQPLQTRGREQARARYYEIEALLGI